MVVPKETCSQLENKDPSNLRFPGQPRVWAGARVFLLWLLKVVVGQEEEVAYGIGTRSDGSGKWEWFGDQ